MSNPESPTNIRRILLFFIGKVSGLSDENPDDTTGGWLSFDPKSITAVDPLAAYPDIEVAPYKLPLLPFIRSVLRYAPHADAMANDLFQTVLASGNARNQIDLLIEMIPSTTNNHPHDIEYRTRGGRSWINVAQRFGLSTHIGAAFNNWATRWAIDLIIGFRSTGSTPRSTPSTVNSTASPVTLSFRGNLFKRDGYITVIGNQLAKGCPRDLIPADESTYNGSASVQACHIVPRSTGGNSGLLQALNCFTGNLNFTSQNLWSNNVQDPQNVNHPSNGLLLQNELHIAYSDNFEFGIEAMNTQQGPRYRIRRLVPNSCADLRLHGYFDKDELHFGRNNQTIPTPSVLYCNIHLAIGKILHASRAGEILQKIRRDEEDLKEGSNNGATWGSKGEAYLLRRLAAIA